MHRIQLKRAYEAPDPADGFRVLVDRIWPRGVRKEQARVDLWMKDVAPSGDLRKWFGHEPQRWAAFRERYLGELGEKPELIRFLRGKAGAGALTLVYAARDREHNNAVVLREYLERGPH